MPNELQCHSSTPKSEVVDFINNNKNKTVIIHYEGNMYPTWGDDDFWEVLLDEEGLKKALNMVDKHYIHGIRIIERKNSV